MQPMEFMTKFDPRAGNGPQWKVVYVSEDGETKARLFWTRPEAITHMTCAGYKLVLVIQLTRRTATARNLLRKWRKHQRHLTHDRKTAHIGMIIEGNTLYGPTRLKLMGVHQEFVNWMKDTNSPFQDWCRHLIARGLE